MTTGRKTRAYRFSAHRVRSDVTNSVRREYRRIIDINDLHGDRLVDGEVAIGEGKVNAVQIQFFVIKDHLR